MGMYRFFKDIKTMAFLGICFPLILFSNPSMPTVIDGSANFSNSGNTFTISTSSDRTIVQWDGFSIGANEITNILQPASTSAILNRVTSANPSDILGSLLSNGQVFLLNPNGIMVGTTGKIDVSGLVLSTLDVLDADFIAGGDMLFTGASTATIQNSGVLEGVLEGVFLLGRHIVNAGDIITVTANTIFGAGESILLRTSQKDIVVNPIIGTPTGTGIDNTGQIKSNRTEFRADGNLFSLAIRHTGEVSALRTTAVDGEIFLVADSGETLVESQGTLVAHGANGGGGRIHILGQTVTVQDQASIITKNDFGGGEVFIGGSPGGTDPDILNAVTTTIGSNVVIETDARVEGSGGDVSVFATGVATFEGTILARGGIAGGAGATVEISGLGNLIFTGVVDTQAFSNGADGLLILDPTDITISNGATAGGAFDGGSPTNTFSGSAAAATLNITDLDTALQTNNVLVTTTSVFGGTGNITIGANTTLNLLATSHTLTLMADNDINVNNDLTMIDSAGGTSILNLTAGNNVNVVDPITGTMLSAINITAGNNIVLTDDISAVGATVTLDASNNINSSGGTPVITAGQLNLTATVDFNVTSSLTLTGGGASSNIVGVIGNDITNTATITFNNWNNASLSTTSGDIIIDSGITANNVTTLTFASGVDFINQGGTNLFNDASGNVTDLIINADQDITINSQIDINNFNSATLTADRDVTFNNDFEPDNTTTVSVNAGRDILITGVAADVIAMNATTLSFTAVNNYTASEPFTVTNVDTVNITATNGTVTVTTPSGQTSVTGANTTVTAGTDINILETFINNGTGDMTLVAANDINIGPSSQVSQVGTRLGTLSLTTGRDLNVVGGTGSSDRSQVGFSSSVVDSNIELSIGRDINVTGGTASSAVAFIGHGFTAPGVYEGDIIFRSVGRNVSITGQQVAGGSTRFAQIGHVRQSGGTSTFEGDIRGSTVGSLAVIPGTLTLTGGASSTNFAHFGHGGGRNSNAADTYSGEIRVRANTIVLNGGTNSDTNASIGFFAVSQTGGTNPVTVTSPAIVQVVSDTTIDMTASTNGTVSIGAYILNSAAHPAVVSLDSVNVRTGGDLTMISGSGTETSASIGAFSTNPTSETNLTMNVGGNLIMTSGTGASAQIINGNGTTAGLISTVNVTGNITPTVTGAFPAFIDAVSGNLSVTAGGEIDLPDLTRIQNQGGSNGTLSVIGGSIFVHDGGFIGNSGTGTTFFGTTVGDVNVVNGSMIDSIGSITGSAANDINVNEDSFISSSAGGADISAGRDISIVGGGTGASSMISSGSGTYTAGRDISLSGASSINEGFIENSAGDLLVIAGNDIDVNFFGRIENLGAGSLTLVVDNLFPSPPLFGPGAFELSSSGSVGRLGGGPLRIFTSVRSQNLIQGSNNLNGETFVPGPLFVNSATEQWGTYFPSSFGGSPFTIFYKNQPTPTPASLLAADPDVFVPFYEIFFLLDGYGMDPSVAWLYEVCICDCSCISEEILSKPFLRCGYQAECCRRLPPYFRKLDLRPYYPR